MHRPRPRAHVRPRATRILGLLFQEIPIADGAECGTKAATSIIITIAFLEAAGAIQAPPDRRPISAVGKARHTVVTVWASMGLAGGHCIIHIRALGARRIMHNLLLKVGELERIPLSSISQVQRPKHVTTLLEGAGQYLFCEDVGMLIPVLCIIN